MASKTGKSGATTSHTRRGERRSAEMIRRHPKFHSSQINSHPRSKHRLLLKSLVSGNGQEDCRAATALCSMTLRCAPACAELTHAARRCRHRPYGCARHGARRQAAIRGKVLLWVGCIAGALRDEEYRDKLAKAGFRSIGIEPTRVYAIEDAREFLAGKGVDVDALAPQVEGKFMSAFVRAVKPAAEADKAVAGTGCAPNCCA